MAKIQTLIFLDAPLSETEQTRLGQELKTLPGVDRSWFSKRSNRLLQVVYDNGVASADRIAAAVQQQGWSPKLVGL